MSKALVIWAAGITLAASGCSGGSRGPTATGSLTLDGKPLSDAQVVFVANEGNATKAMGAIARTDAEGKFRIQQEARGKQNWKPGKYKVQVTKLVDRQGNLPDDPGQLEAAGAGARAKNVVPARYGGDDSPLDVEIKAGENNLPPFELKSR
jgi:hypothetical protein